MRKPPSPRGAAEMARLPMEEVPAGDLDFHWIGCMCRPRRGAGAAQTRIDEARAGAYELTLEALGDEAMRNSPAAFASPENAFRAVNALVAQ